MKIEEIKIKLLDENAKLPTYGTEYAAGCDLYSSSSESIKIKPFETKLIKTGVAVEIPTGYVGLIYARSGLATKRGLAPANKVGVIDSDYRGELMVALHNHTKEEKEIEAYERIAQLVILPYANVELEVVDELTDTVRGDGGFGSTGTN